MEYNSLSVRELLSGKRILITGASGFLAKVFLEKILRDVPDIGIITLLLRPSERNPDVNLRFSDEILGSSVFDPLRHASPSGLHSLCANKIRCLKGDQTAPFLGLDPAEFAVLGEQIDLLVNIAASVNFADPIDQMLRINTLSLKALCALAAIRSIPFIHISTCYVHGMNQGIIPEQVLPAAKTELHFNNSGYYEVEDLIASLQENIKTIRGDEDDEKSLRRKLLRFGRREAQRHGWNDSYTFTKWLGEQLAMKLCAQGRLTILRPAIIESTLQQPMPGWIEGVKVVDTLTVAYARGKLSGMPYRPDGILDIIPADLVANSMVLAAADIWRRAPGVQILQCCSGTRNPLKLDDMVRYINQEIHQNWDGYQNFGEQGPAHPFHNANKLLFWVGLYLRTVLYGACAWLNAHLKASPLAAAVKRFQFLHTLVHTHYAYGHPAYVFDNSRLMELAARFSAQDRAVFAVDPAAIDWESYFCKQHFRGLDKYVLKPPRSVVESTVRQAETVSAAQSA